jgi:hypothetical protein
MRNIGFYYRETIRYNFIGNISRSDLTTSSKKMDGTNLGST